MLTDLDTLSKGANRVDGRGGKRPGAGRPKADGTRSSKTKAPKADFEIRDADELLLNGPPAALDIPAPPEMSTDSGAIDFILPQNPTALFAGAKARKEAAHAAKAELEFKVRAGQYLPREAVRSALAEAYQAVAQSLRSIPDNLERKLGVTPEVAESVSASIDETMGELAYAMEQIHAEHVAAIKD